MRIAMVLLGVSLAVGSAACKKKEKGAGDTTMGSNQGSADTTGSAGSAGDTAGSADGSAAAGSGAGAGSADTQMAKRGGNCPSTVFGSETVAKVEGAQIVLTITSKDKDAVSAIQARSKELLERKAESNTAGQGTAHDQKGTHGGGMGLCPVHLPEGATGVAKNQADGVAITITPKDKVDILKGEVDSRITKAAEWVKANLKEGDRGTTGGVGGGSGEHGSNHSGHGDAKGVDRKSDGGKGGGKGTGGGGGAGTGGGSGNAGSAEKK